MADSMTVERLIRFLSERGHAVDLLTIVRSDAQERDLRGALGGVCREIETVPLPLWKSVASTALTLPGRLPMQAQFYRSAALRKRAAERVVRGDYDVVYTHSIRIAEATRELPLPKVLGVQVCQALNLGRMVGHVRDPFRRLFYEIELAKVRPYEAHVSTHFDLVLLCGPADIAEMEKIVPLPNAVVCPHGQDLPALEEVRGHNREPGAIVISGVMSTYTNVDAASWFAREIFPRVRRELPEAKFWIVGRQPQRAVRALGQAPGVVVTGEVPDVYEWLVKAQVGVAPLRIGAGMQNKVVQAMASELPVVATPIANEGIGAEPGRDLLIGADDEAFAAHVVRLLRDEELRMRVGRAARSFVEANWTWEVHFERLEAMLGGLAEGDDATRSRARATSC
jgi:glycosyltransferase involved in cell wall biosynthesis